MCFNQMRRVQKIEVCTTLVGAQVVRCLGDERRDILQIDSREAGKELAVQIIHGDVENPRWEGKEKGWFSSLNEARGSTKGSHDIMVARPATRSSERH